MYKEDYNSAFLAPLTFVSRHRGVMNGIFGFDEDNITYDLDGTNKGYTGFEYMNYYNDFATKIMQDFDVYHNQVEGPDEILLKLKNGDMFFGAIYGYLADDYMNEIEAGVVKNGGEAFYEDSDDCITIGNLQGINTESGTRKVDGTELRKSYNLLLYEAFNRAITTAVTEAAIDLGIIS